MPGMFDGFSLNIFDDAIFDTKIQTGPPPRIITTIKIPATIWTNRVIDVA